MKNTIKRTLAILALGLSATNTHGTVLEGPIPNPANGHSYYILSQNTWTAAEAEAVALGGHLATVNDAAENAWIANTFSAPLNEAAENARIANPFSAPYYYLWIGLNDAAVEGQFVWSSGQQTTYQNWGQGEPNNFGGDEDYALILNFDGAFRKWNDFSNLNTVLNTVSTFPIYGVAEIENASTPVTIYDAGWSDGVDQDRDGYTSFARLNWDTDTAIGGSITVFEKIFWKLASSPDWTLFSTNAPHIITGTAESDEQHLDVKGGGHDLYDWKIEAYRAGQSSPDYTRDSSNDSDLSRYRMESPGEDLPLPDLARGTDSLTVSAVHPGDSIIPSITITNQICSSGSVAAGAFHVGFYWSSSDSSFAGVSPFYEASVSGCSAGGTVSINPSIPISAATAPGTYFLGYRIDHQNEVAECNEIDNGSFYYWTVEIASPQVTRIINLSGNLAFGDVQLGHLRSAC